MLHFFLPQGQKGQRDSLPLAWMRLFKQAADNSKFPFFAVLNNKKSKDSFKG